MKNSLLSIIVAFIGYSLLNISQASQKIGLSLAKTHRARGITIWIFATLGTSLAAFVLLYAVSIGSASLVGAMSGTGLASLAIFSRFVMKESFGRREIAGVGVILIAAGLIGAFTLEYQPSEIRLYVLYLLMGAVTIVYAGLLLYALIRRKKATIGIVIGGMAGAFGGFIPLFQKVSTSPMGRESSFVSASILNGSLGSGLSKLSSLSWIFVNPYAVLWIVLSIVSVIILQFSYKHERAIKIIPFFSINYIIVPLLGGLLAFHEKLHPGQWMGVALILVGLFLL